MWTLKEGSVTLCLDTEGRPIKLGQGGYGSVYLVPRFAAMIQRPTSVAEVSGSSIAHVPDRSSENAGVDVRLSQQVLTRLQRVCRGSCEGATAWPSRWWR